MLSQLEPIRNNIAHNRKTTDEDVNIVRGAHAFLVGSFGRQFLGMLVSQCTAANDIPARLTQVRQDAVHGLESCRALRKMPVMEAWEQVRKAWWFDDEYLVCDVEPISTYFAALREYAALPRRRGTGHRLEKWLASMDIDSKFDEAEKTFVALIGANNDQPQ